MNIKKFSILSLTLMAVVPVSAVAKDKTDGKSGDLAVEKVICSRSYMKADPAAANYKPGVDVNGNSVAGADLNDQSAMVPTYLEMPLTIDLASKLQATTSEIELKPSMGKLKLYQSGKIEFNGQDITSNIASVCGEPLSKFKVKQETGPKFPVMEKFEPASGSVAPSTTGPEPRPMIDLQQATQNTNSDIMNFDVNAVAQ